MRFGNSQRRNSQKQPQNLGSENQNPEPKPLLATDRETVVVLGQLYAGAAAKAGELMGLAKSAKDKGKRGQLWRAYYDAEKAKEDEFQCFRLAVLAIK